MVDLEVVGRHALLFDDDAMAAFVNSNEALLQWNSLLIDRYDVRHLLQDLPPPGRKPRRPAPPLEPDGVHRSDLDSERYQDLPLDGGRDDNSHSETNRQDSVASGSYQAVSFSYGNTDASSEAKNSDSGLGYSGFHPPFPVPESLLKNLPPTEKVHQIMARTAKFVREHGGQSEIVLRVKQGDNPTFGFLMPDHHLHEYFRFLVDHKELLQTETDVKPSKEDKKVSSGKNQTNVEGGALSLLGSLYGYGEDEDGSGTLHVVTSETKEIESGNSVDAVNVTSSHGPDRVESSVVLAKEDAGAAKHSSAAAVNEKASLAKRGSRAIDTSSGAKSGRKREAETSSSPSSSLCFSEDKPQLTQKPSMFEVEPLIVDPPPFLKKIIDQTVEFILKNGKEFEAVLIKQDTSQGKFQFLLPSNHYHLYYLKLLQKAQEPKLLGKSFTQKLNLQGHKNSKERVQDMGLLQGNDKALSKGFTSVPKTSTELQGAYDSERKEKFRMVIGGSKKDNVDPHSKPAQRQGGVTVDEAAAIVRAASRGHMNTKVESLLKASFNDSGKGLGIGDDGRTSSTGSFSFSCHAHSSASKPTSNGEQGFLKSGELPQSVQQSDKGSKNSDVSVAKAIAKTVALAAATEADSSEASLTREQKQKAERLKRAKMFAAMIKGGGGGQGASESLPHLSMQATGSALSGSMECVGKVPFVRAGSVPVAAAAAVSNLLNSEFGDPMSGEREGSSVPIDVNVSDKVERKTYSDDDDDGGEDRERKRKKHSSRSRRHVDSDEDSKRSRKKHRSERSSHRGRDDHRHRKSHSSNKDREHRHRHRHRHHSSSDDEHGHKNRSDKHRRSHAERELEEGELVSEHSNSIEVEGNAGKTPNDPREGSLLSISDNRSSDATEVPDELRAKVRAMLLATM